MQLIVGGDLVPTQSNIELFIEGDIKGLLGEDLFSIWFAADVRVINIEAPLCDLLVPIKKNGPNLSAPQSTVKGICGLKPTLVSLANNHILDYGAKGLDDTIKTLTKHGIPFVGVGDNLLEASKPYILEQNGVAIGFYACAEHEYAIAKENDSGANPFDPFESLDHIQSLKNECDYVVVIYHGGKEHYRYPSPYLQKACKKMTDKGADIVICQHSHCVGCYEVYKNATIIYGQGNFIFNKYDNEYWNSSILVAINIGNKLNVQYIPITKSGNGICLAEETVAEEILNAFQQRSGEILKDGFIEQKYQEFAQSNIQEYIRNISAFGKCLSIIDRRLLNNLLSNKKYNRKQLLAIQNYVECESHRELLLCGLRLRIDR